MDFTAKRFDTGEVVRVTIVGVAIQSLETVPEPTAPVPWLAPALFDLQVNGGGGVDFSSTELTIEGVAQVVLQAAAAGTARFLPCVVTQSHEAICHGLRTLAAWRNASPAHAHVVPGIHLEGPYLSPEDGPRGAHPLEHIRPPDWDEFCRFQDAAQGLIRVVTLAPEQPGAVPFIKRAIAAGVLVSIGHTGADAEQLRAAVDAGASLSTHLGNGAHVQIRRHPNYLWEQLAEDRLTATLIADGHHLPASVLKAMIRAKHPSRCVLVSDQAAFAGLPPGTYARGSRSVEILPEGKLVVGGQRDYLAGAAAPLFTGLSNAVTLGEVDLSTAVEMAAIRPATLLGLDPPRLAPGNRADVLLFEEQPEGGFRLRTSVCGGTVAGGRL